MRTAAAVAKVVVIVAVVGGSTAAAFSAMGLYINTTPSIPRGIYAADSGPIAVGTYVLFCPPKSTVFDVALRRGYIGAGTCSGSYGYVMKKVLAAKGDVVSISERGVTVNGEALPFTVPQPEDREGRRLMASTVRNEALQASQLLLMADGNAQSFDARYFGLIERAQVITVIRPLITW